MTEFCTVFGTLAIIILVVLLLTGVGEWWINR